MFTKRLNPIKKFSIGRNMSLSADTTWDPSQNLPKFIKEELNSNSKPSLNAFFHMVSQLKVPRTGWVHLGIPEPEHIGDHMYRMSIICLTLPLINLDKEKCIKIALVHDLAEALVGDIVPSDPMGKVEKSKREYKAMLYLASFMGDEGEKIVELWKDYELQRCKEGILVKDIDKYELLLQTWEYENKHNKKLDEFWNCRNIVKNDIVKDLVSELWEKREKFWSQQI
ncbi:5'-deoxynucleotidase [Martiniozyma asiatica (nom. inval.)]|nr:5'-deoxynucleotidase [Martiniozyma asiatica]